MAARHSSMVVATTVKALQSSRHGPIAVTHFERPQRVHLRQSELDGACGQHALMMALIGMGLVTRRQLLLNRSSDTSAIGKLWAALKPLHFDGTHVSDLANAVHEMRDAVGHSTRIGGSRGITHFATAELGKGRFVLVSVEGLGGGFRHWLLAVGRESERGIGRLPRALLLLDSMHDPPTLGVYNARLEIAPRRWGTLSTIDGATLTVALTGALSVWPRR